MSSNNKLGRTESKIRRCIKAPVRALGRARDFYVRSLNTCAGSVGSAAGGAAMMYAGPKMPRSFSNASSASSAGDDDFRDLIRAASSKNKRVSTAQSSPGVVPRSQTIAIRRIDENKPFEFEDDEVIKPNLLFPRSRTYVVPLRSRRR